jgi:hypothetical protein
MIQIRTETGTSVALTTLYIKKSATNVFIKGDCHELRRSNNESNAHRVVLGVGRPEASNGV